MKKFCFLMMMFACSCFNAFAEEQTPAMLCDGKNVCATYPDGGDVEQTRCKNDDNTYKSAGEVCDPKNAPAGKGRCFAQKNKANADVVSCAAKVCNDDSALWLKKKKNSYVSYGLCLKKDWLQHRFCDKNNDKCKDCRGKCTLNVFEYTNGSFGITSAFHNDELCTCQKDDGAATTDNITCNYTYRIMCKDGTDVSELVEGYPIVRSGLTKETLKTDGYKDFNFTEEDLAQCYGELNVENPIFKKMYKKDHDDLQALFNRTPGLLSKVQATCKNKKTVYTATVTTTTYLYTGTGTTNNTAEINNAKSILSNFFADARANKSVWKNSEGKFNTARLASDLTAGVVLGTVGGVVSSIVIKKKQIEKGFDALYCAVGGQKVADWGDEFDVALRTR